MKTRSALLLALAFLVALPALAQERGRGSTAPPNQAHPPSQTGHPPAAAAQSHVRGNQGHIPAASPKARPAPAAKPQTEHFQTGHVNSTPHVSHNTWYGHAAPNDPRFHVDQPFEHGHFANVGPSHRFAVSRIDRDHHFFYLPDGAYFQIADWDWALAADWCWDCGDDFVVYEDPDHPGWYLVYDVETGAYVHAIYMGT